MKRGILFFTLTLLIAKISFSQEDCDACEKLKNNVVKITAGFSDGSDETGFGTIIGENGDKLLVITAAHVVYKYEKGNKSSEVKTQQAKITFYTDQGRDYDATLLNLSNYGFDLTLLEVAKPAGFSWTKDFYSAAIKRGTPVWFIGRTGNWYIPITSGFIDEVSVYDIISIDIKSVLPGTSGAPLISKDGLVGVIFEDASTGAKAYPIEKVRQLIDTWNYSWQMNLNTASLATKENPTNNDGKVEENKTGVPPTSGSKKILNAAIPVGQTISIKGPNGLLMSVANDHQTISATGKTAQATEQFLIVDAGDGKIALKNMDKYVSSENGLKSVSCNSTSIGSLEKFDWVVNSDSTFSLRDSNGKFISSEQGERPMTCTRPSAEGWEKFKVNTNNISGNLIHTASEQPLQTKPQNTLDASGTSATADEQVIKAASITYVEYQMGSNTGIFQQTGPLEWKEKNKDGVFTFTEKSRDDWSIYLTAPGKTMQLDLYKLKVFYNGSFIYNIVIYLTDAADAQTTPLNNNSTGLNRPLIQALRKDGLITGNRVSIRFWKGDFFINGVKQSEEVKEKYKQYFRKNQN